VDGVEALRRNAGLLGAFTLPAPFTATEFRALENELKDGIRENNLEREKLRVRQLELDEWEETLRTKQAELAEIRTRLENHEASLDLRQAELLRDENAKVEAEMQGWKALAKTYKGAKAEVNARNLELETPEDAALILLELSESQAGEILRLIEPPSTRKEYMDAYRRAAEKR
jgi:flagellar motility protein MotE (MotC chaperone)